MAEMENRKSEADEERIDIISSFLKSWKMLKRTWWLLFLCIALGTGIMFINLKFIYTPEYEAAASFTIGNGKYQYSGDNYTSIVSLKQLSATFPYILESGALKKVVAEDLGLSDLPAEITASVIEETNLFQITVKSKDAQLASDILESVIANYPTVARYIIGDTTLTMLDNTGVPLQPSNSLGLKQEMTKGAIGGTFVYLFLLIIITATRKTVNSEEDLKRYVNLRCLASIPRTYMKRRSGKYHQLMLIDHKVTPDFVESINTLRIRISRALHDGKNKVIVVTSSNESEGKTTIVTNLALSYAIKGYKVLLIDGDLRNPSVARMLGLDSANGLETVLKEHHSLAEVVVPYAKSSLEILANNVSMNHNKVTSYLGSSEMKKLIDEARNRYDYILIDTPPCGMMQDAATLCSFSDYALMVIKQDYMARDRILNALEILAETGISLLGYVINSEETGIGSYGYGRYGYGKYGYGKYGKNSTYGYGEETKKEREKR